MDPNETQQFFGEREFAKSVNIAEEYFKKKEEEGKERLEDGVGAQYTRHAHFKMYLFKQFCFPMCFRCFP